MHSTGKPIYNSVLCPLHVSLGPGLGLRQHVMGAYSWSRDKAGSGGKTHVAGAPVVLPQGQAPPAKRARVWKREPAGPIPAGAPAAPGGGTAAPGPSQEAADRPQHQPQHQEGAAVQQQQQQRGTSAAAHPPPPAPGSGTSSCPLPRSAQQHPPPQRQPQPPPPHTARQGGAAQHHPPPQRQPQPPPPQTAQQGGAAQHHPPPQRQPQPPPPQTAQQGGAAQHRPPPQRQPQPPPPHAAQQGGAAQHHPPPQRQPQPPPPQTAQQGGAAQQEAELEALRRQILEKQARLQQVSSESRVAEAAERERQKAERRQRLEAGFAKAFAEAKEAAAREIAASKAPVSFADAAEVARVLAAKSDYDVLRLQPGATGAAVRRRYRELAVTLHPDKCRTEGASEAFQRLVRAYHSLLQFAR